MEYCLDAGIPYSEFLERWSESDRALVSAAIMEKSSRCSGCGTSEWEWGEDPYAYHPIFHTCPGCQKKEILGDDDTPRAKGTTVRLVPKAVAERLAYESTLQDAGPSRPRRRGR